MGKTFKKRQREGYVLAMKNGIEKWFNDYLWERLPAHKNGWQLVGTTEPIEEIAIEEIEIKEEPKEKEPPEEKDAIPIIKKEIPDEEIKVTDKGVEDKAEGEKVYPSDDEIRDFLNELADKGKIKKPHHLAGTKKLRAIYDENTK